MAVTKLTPEMASTLRSLLPKDAALDGYTHAQFYIFGGGDFRPFVTLGAATGVHSAAYIYDTARKYFVLDVSWLLRDDDVEEVTYARFAEAAKGKIKA